MRLKQRLLLGLLPAVGGIMTVTALAYRENHIRQAPYSLVAIGSLAVILSLAISWWNVRYVAERVTRLAHERHPPAGDGARVAPLPNDAACRQALAAEARLAEYARLAETVATPVAARLREAQLPLHILLENRFGELNENQEEMIEAARRAIEAVDVDIRHIRRLVTLDRERAAPPAMAIRPLDLLRPALAIATARGERNNVKVQADIPLELPHVAVEPYRAEEALTAVLCAAVDQTAPGRAVILTAESADPRVVLRVAHDGTMGVSLELSLAGRLLYSAGGDLELETGRTTVRFDSSPVTGTGR